MQNIRFYSILWFFVSGVVIAGSLGDSPEKQSFKSGQSHYKIGEAKNLAIDRSPPAGADNIEFVIVPVDSSGAQVDRFQNTVLDADALRYRVEKAPDGSSEHYDSQKSYKLDELKFLEGTQKK